MKITYEFDTDSDTWLDDVYTQKRFMKSLDMALCLEKIENKLRLLRKYDDAKTINIEDASRFFNNLLTEYNIDLEELLR